MNYAICAASLSLLDGFPQVPLEQPYEAYRRLGGQDVAVAYEHGCNLAAGEQWCGSISKCITQMDKNSLGLQANCPSRRHLADDSDGKDKHDCKNTSSILSFSPC